jgi:hypothetical protein
MKILEVLKFLFFYFIVLSLSCLEPPPSDFEDMDPVDEGFDPDEFPLDDESESMKILAFHVYRNCLYSGIIPSSSVR